MPLKLESSVQLVEYDGVENYLLHKVGIDSETIDRVKANLIV